MSPVRHFPVSRVYAVTESCNLPLLFTAGDSFKRSDWLSNKGKRLFVYTTARVFIASTVKKKPTVLLAPPSGRILSAPCGHPVYELFYDNFLCSFQKDRKKRENKRCRKYSFFSFYSTVQSILCVCFITNCAREQKKSVSKTTTKSISM